MFTSEKESTAKKSPLLKFF